MVDERILGNVLNEVNTKMDAIRLRRSSSINYKPVECIKIDRDVFQLFYRGGNVLLIQGELLIVFNYLCGYLEALNFALDMG